MKKTESNVELKKMVKKIITEEFANNPAFSNFDKKLLTLDETIFFLRNSYGIKISKQMIYEQNAVMQALTSNTGKRNVQRKKRESWKKEDVDCRNFPMKKRIGKYVYFLKKDVETWADNLININQ